MSEPTIDSLRLCLQRFAHDADRDYIRAATTYLNCCVWHAVDVALVVESPGPQLAPGFDAQQFAE